MVLSLTCDWFLTAGTKGAPGSMVMEFAVRLSLMLKIVATRKCHLAHLKNRIIMAATSVYSHYTLVYLPQLQYTLTILLYICHNFSILSLYSFIFATTSVYSHYMPKLLHRRLLYICHNFSILNRQILTLQEKHSGCH